MTVVMEDRALPTVFGVHGLPLWRRFLLRLFRIRVCYNSVTSGLESGPCIVICNHQSLLDGVIIAVASPFPLTFPVTTKYSRDSRAARTVLHWLEGCGLGRVVPMDVSHYFSLRKLRQALLAGESIMIFPEGKLAPEGAKQMPGYLWLQRQTGAPVVEARIAGADHSRFFSRGGKHLWPRITLHL